MPTKPKDEKAINILAITQAGRLQYEAALLAASLAQAAPNRMGQLYFAEPQPGNRWDRDPRMNNSAVRELLEGLGARLLPFENHHFGANYPQGNKIEALFSLPKGEPFLFLDTDTLILDDPGQVPFDFARPSASLRVEGTWPKIELYGPGYAEIWKSLYEKFGLDYEASLDPSQPQEYWRRHAYFNAGFFYYRCPHEFGQRFLDYALAIRDDHPPELVCQSLNPWLDQVALPLVLQSLGGGRDALEPGYMDGSVTCHYRVVPLLYARESDHVVDILEQVSAPNKIKKVLKEYEPFKRMIYQKRGAKVRALFDRDRLPTREQAIRNTIKREGFWMR